MSAQWGASRRSCRLRHEGGGPYSSGHPNRASMWSRQGGAGGKLRARCSSMPAQIFAAKLNNTESLSQNAARHPG